MDLTVKDVADVLQVPTGTVYRWISEKNLPAQHVREQYFVNRGQLLEWAAINAIPVGPKIFRDEKGNRYSQIGFTHSLESGGIIYDLPGTTKEAVLREMVARLPVTDILDRELVLQLFLARESTGSTAVGKGIAIPHSRQPIIVQGTYPSLSLFFLSTPVAFGAADGQPVFALFTIVAPTVRTHLHLLARVSFALHDAAFRDAINRRASQADIIGEARRVESTFDEQSKVETNVGPQ